MRRSKSNSVEPNPISNGRRCLRNPPNSPRGGPPLYEKKELDISRRKFLQVSVAGLALAGLPDWVANEAVAAEYERPLAKQKKFGPNDQINFGLIGAGGSRGGYRQGLGDARAAHSQRGCKVIAVCDVDTLHREEAAKVFGPDTAKFANYRELLARKDID